MKFSFQPADIPRRNLLLSEGLPEPWGTSPSWWWTPAWWSSPWCWWGFVCGVPASLLLPNRSSRPLCDALTHSFSWTTQGITHNSQSWWKKYSFLIPPVIFTYSSFSNNIQCSWTESISHYFFVPKFSFHKSSCQIFIFVGAGMYLSTRITHFFQQNSMTSYNSSFTLES